MRTLSIFLITASFSLASCGTEETKSSYTYDYTYNGCKDKTFSLLD